MPCITSSRSVTFPYKDERPQPDHHITSQLVSLDDPRLENLDLVNRPVLGPRLDEPHPLDNGEPALDAAKDGVLAVEPRRRRQRDEELAAVRVGAGVGHAEDAGAVVAEVGVDLVGKLVAVDRGAAAAGARRVAGLDHKVGDDAVHERVVVVAARGERREVGARLGRVRRVELEQDRALERERSATGMGTGRKEQAREEGAACHCGFEGDGGHFGGQ